MTSISSNPFLTPALLRQGGELRKSVQIAARETTTGQVADPAQRLKGDFSSLAALETRLVRLAAYKSVSAELTLIASSQQASLGLMAQRADALAAELHKHSSEIPPLQLSIIVNAGHQDYVSVIQALNSRIGDRAIFSGIVSDQSPLPEPELLLDAIEASLAGLTTADEINLALRDFFTDPTGFAALYAGGPPRDGVKIADGEQISLSMTAADPAIRDTLQGLALVALLNRGLGGGDDTLRSALAISAASHLITGATGRAEAMGRVGIIEEKLATARTRNGTESSALTLSRIERLEVDPAEAAARLTDLETRLESFYVILARLSRLTLTEYLR